MRNGQGSLSGERGRWVRGVVMMMELNNLKRIA